MEKDKVQQIYELLAGGGNDVSRGAGGPSAARAGDVNLMNVMLGEFLHENVAGFGFIMNVGVTARPDVSGANNVDVATVSGNAVVARGTGAVALVKCHDGEIMNVLHGGVAGIYASGNADVMNVREGGTAIVWAKGCVKGQNVEGALTVRAEGDVELINIRAGAKVVIETKGNVLLSNVSPQADVTIDEKGVIRTLDDDTTVYPDSHVKKIQGNKEPQKSHVKKTRPGENEKTKKITR